MKRRVKKSFRLRFLKEKVGLSEVIATLIIVLVAIVAVTIVWIVISNVIHQGAEGVSLNKISFGLTIESAYRNGANISVGVQRSTGQGNMTGLRFTFYNGKNSTIIDRNVSLGQLQEKTFIFNPSEIGDASIMQSVSVAPLFEQSGKIVAGTVMDTKDVGPGTGIFCGNGKIETGEQCDGSNLGGIGCIDIGFSGGNLSCSKTCQLDWSNCTIGGLPCGNEIREPGQTCDYAAPLGPDNPYGSNCTGTCTVDGAPGGWLGCRGQGISICIEKVTTQYYINHPLCIRNVNCQGQYYSCNDYYCPPPVGNEIP